MSKNAALTLGVLLYLLPSLALHASEPDDLTHRPEVLSKHDAAPTINAIVNQQIEGAARELNKLIESRKETKTCVELQAEFIELLRMRLISSAQKPNQFIQPFAQAETWLSSSSEAAEKLFQNKKKPHPWRTELEGPAILADFPAYGFTPKLEDSIFTRITNTDKDPEHGSVSPYAWGMVEIFIAGSIHLGGNVVGNDKIGHFFWEGWEYWRRLSKETNLIEGSLKWGENAEATYFGMGRDPITARTTWGIYSYADLATNIDGLLFWDRLFSGDKPHLTCASNQVKVAAPFEIMDYATPLWDQGINCSEYRPKVAIQIEARLKELKISCPVVEKTCKDLGGHPLAERILFPGCRSTTKTVAPKTLSELRDARNEWLKTYRETK